MTKRLDSTNTKWFRNDLCSAIVDKLARCFIIDDQFSPILSVLEQDSGQMLIKITIEKVSTKQIYSFIYKDFKVRI